MHTFTNGVGVNRKLIRYRYWYFHQTSMNNQHGCLSSCPSRYSSLRPSSPSVSRSLFLVSRLNCPLFSPQCVLQVSYSDCCNSTYEMLT